MGAILVYMYHCYYSGVMGEILQDVVIGMSNTYGRNLYKLKRGL